MVIVVTQIFVVQMVIVQRVIPATLATVEETGEFHLVEVPDVQYKRKVHRLTTIRTIRSRVKSRIYKTESMI